MERQTGAPQLEVKPKGSWPSLLTRLRAGYGGAEFSGTYPAVSVQV